MPGGAVVAAVFAEWKGLDAVRRALRLKEGEFRVELNVKAKARTIFEPWSKLVLQELVASDEEQYGNRTEASEADEDEADDDGPEPGSRPLVPVEERSMEMSESLKVCPLCRRQYLRGTTCQEDGALLVEAGAAAAQMSGVGRTSSPRGA